MRPEDRGSEPNRQERKTIAVEIRYDLYANHTDSKTLTDTPVYSLTLAPIGETIFLEEIYGRSTCHEAASDRLFIVVGSTARQSVGRDP